MSGRCMTFSGLAVCLVAFGGAVLAEQTATPVAPAPEEVPAVPQVPAKAPQPAKDDAAPPPDGHCDRCGSCRSVRTVCVPVPVEREKVKVCWSYRCEEICIPGPSIFCGKSCECDECGPWWKQWWKPTCAHTITKRVPVKREVTRKVPGFEWKVQERCCQCR